MSIQDVESLVTETQQELIFLKSQPLTEVIVRKCRWWQFWQKDEEIVLPNYEVLARIAAAETHLRICREVLSHYPLT